MAWTEAVYSSPKFTNLVFHFTVTENNRLLLATVWHGSNHNKGTKKLPELPDYNVNEDIGVKQNIHLHKYSEVSMVIFLCLVSEKTSVLPVLLLSSWHALVGTTFLKKVSLKIHSPGNAMDFYTMHFTCCSIELIPEASQGIYL